MTLKSTRWLWKPSYELNGTHLILKKKHWWLSN